MNTKICYNYNSTTGEYIGTDTACAYPREPENYVPPANATFVVPPHIETGKTAVWNGTTWELKDDHRGEVWYSTVDQTKHEIKELTESIAADWTQTAPTDAAQVWNGTAWELPFDVAKTRKIAEIQAQSNSLVAAIRSGYTEGEVESFEQQYSGATAILAGDETTTAAQFVISLLTGRLGHTPTSDEKQAFATLITNNYTAAANATAQILGTQQRLELAARACTSAEELASIVWPEEAQG